MNWLKSNPLIAGVGLLIAIVAVIAFFNFLDKGRQRHEGQLVNQGELIERGESNAKVINDVGTGRRAADEPTANELNRVCGKYDRNCPHDQ